MRDDAERHGGIEHGPLDAQRRRPRPRPTRGVLDGDASSRRRLGRFFAAEHTESDGRSAPTYPDHFPGVPRPERIPPEPARPRPHPRPGPRSADRP